MNASTKNDTSPETTCARAALALEVYNAMLEETDTFEGEIGADIAYFMGEVLKGDKFQAWLGSNDEFARLLVRSFGPDHRVWGHVELMNDDGGAPLPDRVATAVVGCVASGKNLGDLDEEDYPAAGVWLEVLRKL
jgi:hypothetical protein